MNQTNLLFKLLVLLIIMSTIFDACDPAWDTCTEPRCTYSDVYAEIPVNLSGNLHPIIHIGDTIRLYMKIPDTLETNYGDLKFEALLYNSYFGIVSGGFDTLTSSNAIGVHYLNPILLKYSKMKSGSITWDYDTREYECLYIPKEKGKYFIDGSTAGRIEMTATDGQSWLINPVLSFDSPKRYEQYASWMSPELWARDHLNITQKKAWYNFEVVE